MDAPLFTANNTSLYATIIILGVLVLVICFFIATLIVKNTTASKSKIIVYLTISFLILYFPILEYWSIWIESFTLWPAGFTADGTLTNKIERGQDTYDWTFLKTDTNALSFPMSLSKYTFHDILRPMRNIRMVSDVVAENRAGLGLTGNLSSENGSYESKRMTR